MSRDFVRSMPRAGALPSSAQPRGLVPDPMLTVLLAVVMSYGLVVLYSAISDYLAVFRAQLIRLGLGVLVMLVLANLHPRIYLRWAPLVYLGGTALLVAVLLMGVNVKGSTRWLDLPLLPRFQPSEVRKRAVPMAVAWYLHDRPLPPTLKDVAVCLAIIGLPAGLIVLQPDLGTGILVAAAGALVMMLGGLRWRLIGITALLLAAAAPVLWQGLQDYQRQRILTLFDPESDPLGAGWNIIQSTTAIGSGGVSGKGLFHGTQSHLEFLPEAQSDFIIAVIGEELGLVGICTLLVLYVLIVGRGLYTAATSPRTFDRLLSGALTLTFFVYVFVNVGMVSGLLPVVGVPLPLISYGGTSAMTLLAGFGIVMSVYKHREW